MDQALSDGSIHGAEADGLMAQAQKEGGLDATERARLVGLIRSWQRIL